jgi:hypothetical protein
MQATTRSGGIPDRTSVKICLSQIYLSPRGRHSADDAVARCRPNWINSGICPMALVFVYITRYIARNHLLSGSQRCSNRAPACLVLTNAVPPKTQPYAPQLQ